MSTILKALRRLEQDRSKGTERPLREDVVLARTRRRAPWLAWAVAGAALALGFGATWAVLATFGGGESPAAPATAPAVPPGATAAGLVPTPGPVAAPPPAAATPTPSPVASAPPPPPTVRVAAGAPGVPPPAAAPPSFPAATPAPVRAAAAPPPRPAPAPAPVRSVPRVEPEPEPEDDVVFTRPILGREPRFVDEDDEAPARSARAAVPVRVVRTSWHPQSDRRSAWVAVGGEGEREVREGQWVGALEVRTIEPDGVLFADGPLLVHRATGER